MSLHFKTDENDFIQSVIRESNRLSDLKSEEEKHNKSIKSEINKLEEIIQTNDLARIALDEFAKQEQEQIKTNIEDLVTLALQSVFDRDWKFKLHLERKRNNFEIRPVIVENGEEFDPKDELGGGAIDIISYALRIVMFVLSEDENSERVMWLDEPMKFVGTGDTLNKAGSMIKEIAEKMNIQTIMITHDSELAEISDKAYEVIRKNDRSEVIMTVGKNKKKIEKKKRVKIGE